MPASDEELIDRDALTSQGSVDELLIPFYVSKAFN
jgi:hypothetical protein